MTARLLIHEQLVRDLRHVEESIVEIIYVHAGGKLQECFDMLSTIEEAIDRCMENVSDEILARSLYSQSRDAK